MNLKIPEKLTRSYPIDKLLLIDFCCAFAGAAFYWFAYKVLIAYLSPLFLNSQLIANFSYGLFGLSLFLFNRQSKTLFSILVKLNIAYASVILILSIATLISGNPIGAVILLVESLLIFVLARVELNALKARS